MITLRNASIALWIATSLFTITIVAAQEKLSLEQVETEERSIVREIINNGVRSRLVIPGVSTQSSPPAALTISDVRGFWSLEMELPSDQIPQRNMQSVIFGNGSIHRFNGEVRFDNVKLPVFVGEGDQTNRLTFVLLKDIGYVYVRGNGKVIFPDGRTVNLEGVIPKHLEDKEDKEVKSNKIRSITKNEILQSQETLAKLGYNPGPVDGIWGKKTEQAIREFQKDFGLTSNGKLDEQTLEKINNLNDNLIEWDDLTDDYNVKERELKNIMIMEIFDNRYIVKNPNGDFLTRFPGTYGGVTISGMGGKLPKVKPLMGYMEGDTPDPQFYSVIGIGCVLELPDQWVKVFGVNMKGAKITFHRSGIIIEGGRFRK